jgi:hypothetical protein
MKLLSDLKAAFGLSPKTLAQATGTIADAQAALNSVEALFSAAGLDLPAMLAAGPDSLKAHLASLDQAEGIKALELRASGAEAKVTEITGQLATEQTAHGVTAEALKVHAAALKSVGFDAAAKDKDGKPVEFSAAFKSHVAQEATLLLAKDGRPPVVTGLPAAKPGAKKGPTMTFTEWKALGDCARAQFFKDGGSLDSPAHVAG